MIDCLCLCLPVCVRVCLPVFTCVRSASQDHVSVGGWQYISAVCQ